MEDYIEDELTYRIIGAAIEVSRELGAGFLEGVYQEALGLEFTKRGIPFRREVSYTVSYKGQKLGYPYKADFVVFEKVIVETKAIVALNEHHVAQVVNYLKASSLEVGLLLNFGKFPIEKRRIALSPKGSSAASASSV